MYSIIDCKLLSVKRTDVLFGADCLLRKIDQCPAHPLNEMGKYTFPNCLRNEGLQTAQTFKNIIKYKSNHQV